MFSPMSKILFAFVLIALVAAQESILEKHQKELNFLNFSKKHGKKYTSLEESLYRLSIYKDNLKRIEELKQENPNATFAQNKFSDLSKEELIERFAGAKPPAETSNSNSKSEKPKIRGAGKYPASLDLRTQAGVQPIRDQGQCGSCWAHSVVATIEYGYWRKYGYAGDLSEQHVVDCVYDQDGCNGGWMPQAFNYLQKNGGLAWEWDYKYTAKNGVCKNASVKNKVSVWLAQSGAPYVHVDSDDDSIKSAIANNGVLSVCTEVYDWGMYQSGIYQDKRFENQNKTANCAHAVNIVGYGTENGIPYYIVRNSWDTWWGEKGYIRMDARRHPNGQTYSGLDLFHAYYPIVY